MGEFVDLHLETIHLPEGITMPAEKPWFPSYNCHDLSLLSKPLIREKHTSLSLSLFPPRQTKTFYRQPILSILSPKTRILVLRTAVYSGATKNVLVDVHVCMSDHAVYHQVC
jgi:hypothetical protein